MSIYGPGILVTRIIPPKQNLDRVNGRINQVDKRMQTFISNVNNIIKVFTGEITTVTSQMHNVTGNINETRDKIDVITGKIGDVDNRRLSTFIVQKENKDIITIWAEEKGTLDSGRYEWSFGNSANNRYSGYPMSVTGRILRMSISAVKSGRSGRGLEELDTITIHLVINGTTLKHGITKLKDVRSTYTIFNNPIEVMAGSVINFVTTSAPSVDAVSVVVVLVELDL